MKLADLIIKITSIFYMGDSIVRLIWWPSDSFVLRLFEVIGAVSAGIWLAWLILIIDDRLHTSLARLRAIQAIRRKWEE